MTGRDAGTGGFSVKALFSRYACARHDRKRKREERGIKREFICLQTWQSTAEARHVPDTDGLTGLSHLDKASKRH